MIIRIFTEIKAQLKNTGNGYDQQTRIEMD